MIDNFPEILKKSTFNRIKMHLFYALIQRENQFYFALLNEIIVQLIFQHPIRLVKHLSLLLPIMN